MCYLKYLSNLLKHLIHLQILLCTQKCRVIKFQHKIFIAAFVKSFRMTKFFGIMVAPEMRRKVARDFVEKRFLAQPSVLRNWRKELR